MGKEIVECKASGLKVNKASKCPDYTCDNCPELKIFTAGHRHYDYKKRSSEPITVSPLAFPLYDFLKWIIELDQRQLSECNQKIHDVKDFLQDNALLLSKDELTKAIEHIETLALIKHQIGNNKQQKKNIPLDCLLIFLHVYCKLNIEQISSYLTDKSISDIDIEALKKRLYRALKKYDLYEITSKIINILPDFYFRAKEYLIEDLEELYRNGVINKHKKNKLEKEVFH